MYSWEHQNWPSFTRNDSALLEPLSAARLAQGSLLGSMSRLGFDVQTQAHLAALTEDVIKSSEIEGEVLNRASVRSSVARRLGVINAATAPEDEKTEGVVAMMMDATINFRTVLTEERLFGWHAALFPRGYSGFHRVTIGTWRDDAAGPMQVVSGPLGREAVHYVAPPAQRVNNDMLIFLNWFNSQTEPEGLIRAAMAHLWFVTIHPFDDGNGRIARAIADMALAQSEGSPQRFYSMSSQIRKERVTYYQVLEQTQKAALDVTPWLTWFLGCFTRAVESVEEISGTVLRKAEFWQRHIDITLNERQRKILNRVLDGFEGKLTAQKWAVLGKCSAPTAQRDIGNLIAQGILQKNPGGSKNSSYDLAE